MNSTIEPRHLLIGAETLAYLFHVINETRERFIKSIAEKVAPDRVVEAFFFPAIRQGPMETGVAVIAATQVLPAPVEGAEMAEAVDPIDRAEVITASYRWTRKGVERGKWVVEVSAVADAPLETVETVVRGVQQRAGEALDAHRMSGDEIRAVLPPVEPPAPAPEAEPVAASAEAESAPAESAA
jgi:hypothetical protein